MRSVLACVVVGGLCGVAGLVRAAEPTLAEIIEAVRENELLYERIDFAFRSEYRTFNRHLLPPNDATSKIVHEEDARVRIVYQPPYLLRQQDSKQWYGGEDRKELPFYVAFDGEKTRMVHDRLGNITTGFVKNGLYITPHNLLVHTWADIPLSLYLSGSDAIAKSEWKVGFNGSVKTYYKGVEEWRGLGCHRVYIHHYFPGRGDSGATELWLAEDRNFIPARAVGYAFWLSRTEPDGEAEVTEWREIKPGIWLPWRSTVRAYYVGQLRPPGKDNRHYRRDITFESVQLGPAHEASHFRFEFPPGTYVYEVEHGEIGRSYVAGSPADPNIRQHMRANRRQLWWLGLTFIGCILVGIVVAQYWRKRRLLAATMPSAEPTGGSNPLASEGVTHGSA